MPALAVVAFVAIYPLGKTVYQSFTNQEFLAGIEPTKWVGLDNYRTLWHDPDLPALRLGDGQVHADHRLLRVRARADHRAGRQLAASRVAALMRAVMLVPWAIPTVVAAQMWKWMLDDVFGVVNDAG